MLKYDILNKYSKTWESDPPNDKGGFYDGSYGRRYIFKNESDLIDCKFALLQEGLWLKEVDHENLTICDKDVYETLFD